MADLRPPVRTPLVPAAVRVALAAAWRARLDEEPPPDAVAVLLAQIGQETGWHSCVCWNIGNVKGAPKGTLPVCQFTTTEVVDGVTHTLVQTFRAFDSLEQACEFQITFLARHYPGAFDAARNADPAGFAHALKVHGYYTGSEADYARNMAAAFDAFRCPSLATTAEVSAALAKLGVDVSSYPDAVRAFQASHGLTVDGVVGHQTRAAIRAAMSAP